MVTLLRHGNYNLIETHNQTKLLKLDANDQFAWIWSESIGELLVSTHTTHKTDHILAEGAYTLYDVKDEPDLTDLQHLELSIGNGKWQGYLLLTGLPNKKQQRKRIVPTTERIIR